MYYSDLQGVKEDLKWLAQSCSVTEFAASRLTDYELSVVEGKLTKSDDASLRSFYEIFFETFYLEAPHWKKGNEPSESDLPVFALIPGEGVRIVIEKRAEGSWKSDGKTGLRNDKGYPEGTLFSPVKIKRHDAGDRSATAMFKSIAMEQKNIIFYAAMASLSINIFALGTSFFTMQVYDRVIPTNGIETLFALGFGVFIAIFFELILKLSRTHILDAATVNMDIGYSHNIFARFLKIRSDALPKSIGTLSGQLQSYQSVRAFISSAALYVFVDFPFSLIFLAAIIMLGGWIMGGIVIVILIAAIFVGIFFRKKIEHLSKTSTMASHHKLGLLVESVESAENIKATGSGWKLLARWNTLTKNAIDDDIEIKHYSEMSTYVSAFLQQIGYVLLVIVGAYLITTGTEMMMGALIATTILSGRILSPIAMLPNILVQWGRAKISIADLDRVFAMEQDNEGIQRPLTPASLKANIRCDNVIFAYGEDMQAIRVPRLTINSGERVGMIGPIGSGKSTMLKMLSGIYKPREGNVFIDGIDMQHISRNHLNEVIGYLPQAVKLISGTLRENLLLGLAGVEDELILDAAKKSGLIHFINILPQGLDTPVPEGGEVVSGGQKQLIAITRLLIMRPKIWLLDEPTANMDEQTERRVIETIIQEVGSEDILVVVTHKMTTLQMIERLLVVAPQGIVLDGKKEDVIEKLKNASLQQKQG